MAGYGKGAKRGGVKRKGENEKRGKRDGTGIMKWMEGEGRLNEEHTGDVTCH